jgi:hypothetical protein
MILADSFLAYSSTQKLQAACSSETSVDFQWTIWRYILEAGSLHNDCCENLKSYIILILNVRRTTFKKEYDAMGYHLQFPIITRPQKVKRCERGVPRSLPDLLKNEGQRGGN